MTALNKNIPLAKVLLVDDSKADTVIAQQFLKNDSVIIDMDTVASSEDALHYLKQVPTPEPKQLPHLILLDLHLPKTNGYQLLALIREYSSFSRIPTIILSHSNSKEDEKTAHLSGASGYITKPIDYKKFSKVIKPIAGLYFQSINSQHYLCYK